VNATRSNGATWAIGLVDGALLGFLALIFFVTGLIGLAVIVAVSYAAFRSLPLVSGMLVGAGGVVAALLVRQMILICNEPDRAACPPGGLAMAAAYGVGLLLLGLLLSALSMRRPRLGG
jgi:hypothetical protein